MPISNHQQPRRGTIVVMSAIMMVLLFGMVAFSVDVGYIVNARTELQRTADACAMAAVMQLPDQSAAATVATEVAQQNLGTVGPALDPADVEFGYWNRNKATFVSPAPSGRSANAVRVTLYRSQAKDNALNLFVAPLMDTDTADAVASSIAMVDKNLCGPFVGIEWVDVPGSPQTDSFDSRQGPYTPGHAGDRGSLCSDGPIDVEGAAYVRGDAHAGRNDEVTLYGGGVVTGALGQRLKPLNMPAVDTSEVAVSNDNTQIPMIQKGNSWVSVVDANGNLLLDGTKTIDLPAGKYYLNNVTMEGQSVLNIMGKVELYITGDFRRAGGTNVNVNTGIASNFQVYMTGGTADITSNNDLYGVIYAPNTDVIIDGDSDLFGAVVGKTLTLTGGGHAHYDEALELDGVSLPARSALVQ